METSGRRVNPAATAIVRKNKSLYIKSRLDRFKWVLTEVIKDHGHTISLLEAALIAESIPDRYDYDAYLVSIYQLQFGDSNETENSA